MRARQASPSVRRLGVHTSIAGGLHLSIERARALGCTTVQIFTHSPRGWSSGDIPEHEMALFRKLRKKYGISPAYVHCSYLINLSSGSAPTRARSAAMLREEMARADAVGAEFVILHLHGGKEERRMTVEGITEALRGGRFTSRLIIENTSRTKVSELAEVIDGAGGLVEGVCLDSCHAFAAGYDMRTGEGMDVLSREIRAHVGLRAVKLLHLNDSKGECGSGVDRHEHIGRGRVGTDGLKRYVDAFKNIPLVLETPRKGEEDDAANLAQVREMLAG